MTAAIYTLLLNGGIVYVAEIESSFGGAFAAAGFWY